MAAEVIDLFKVRAARGMVQTGLPQGVPPLGAPPRNDDCIVHDWTKQPITATYIFCRHCGLTTTVPQPLQMPLRRFRFSVLKDSPAAPKGGAA